MGKPVSIGEIADFIIINEDRLFCGGCGRKLKDVSWSLEMYPHSGGVLIKERGEKMWVYVHCRFCGYDTALWKLIKQIWK